MDRNLDPSRRALCVIADENRDDALAEDPLPGAFVATDAVLEGVRELVRQAFPPPAQFPAVTEAELQSLYAALNDPKLERPSTATFGCSKGEQHRAGEARRSEARLKSTILRVPDSPLVDLQRHCREIDQAVACLSADLTELFENLQTTGYREVSVWSHFPDVNSLETVVGFGDTPNDFHHLRRSISEDAILQDIVVRVFKEGYARRILDGKWHQGYDYYIWKEEGHDRFKDRLFVPLIVLRSSDGTLSYGPCRWMLCAQGDSDQAWKPVEEPGLTIEPIGALSLSNTNRLPASAVKVALELSAKVALRTHGITLQGVMDRMLGTLREASRARSGTIHFVPEGNALDYFSRKAGERGSVSHICFVSRLNQHAQEEGWREAGVIGGPPRHDGIGVQTLNDGKPRHVGGSELRNQNFGLWLDGVRRLSVYPLCASSGDLMGLVYLHQLGNDEDLRTGPELELLVDRVANALSQAAQKLRQRRRAQERAAISHIVRRFLLSRSPEFADTRVLMKALAGALASFLGADAVVLRDLNGFVAKAGYFPLKQPTLAARFSPVPTSLYARTQAGLARQERFPLVVRGRTLGSILVGYAAGNRCADMDLIQQLADLGAFALNLSRHGEEHDEAVERALSAFTKKRLSMS